MDQDAGIIRSLVKSISACALLICLPESVHTMDGADTSSRASSSSSHLDQKKIHRIYTEGDFEGVIAAIDSFTLSHNTHGHGDSVFIAKHLAVIYTANPLTREKGKSYMFRLLNLLPSAKIVDMFVSEEIDRIFDKVREEYVITQQSKGLDKPTLLESNQFAIDQMTKARTTRKDSADAATTPMHSPPATATATATAKAWISPTAFWIASGAALVAATGTLVYVLSSDSQAKTPQDVTYVIPH